MLVYSQTHGAEFSGATHFSIAAQLAAVLQARSDAYLLVKRHPSEERSAYESLRRRFGADRVLVAPPGASAASCARAADVACAISSTALRDAAAAGCPAIEVLSPESLVRHPVAASRVEPQELAAALLDALQGNLSRMKYRPGHRPSPQSMAHRHSQKHCAPSARERPMLRVCLLAAVAGSGGAEHHVLSLAKACGTTRWRSPW